MPIRIQNFDGPDQSLDESRFNIRIGVFQHQNESMCFSTLKLEIIHNFLLRTREDVMHREIIDNFLLRTEEDVIHNIHQVGVY